MAVIMISPESSPEVLLLLCEANRLRDFAENRIIDSDDTLQAATNDLAVIARVQGCR